MAAKFAIGERTDYILDTCRGKRVLHIGCADMPFTEHKLKNGTLLHCAIEQVASVQYGIDLSDPGIAALREAGFTNVAASDILVNNPFDHLTFDIVLAGEVIEHLENPGQFLRGLRQILSSADARLVITTVNANCAYRFLYTLFTNDEKVHQQHVAYYSRKTLTELIQRCDYEVESFAYYNIGREHVPYLKTGARRLLLLADRLACRFRPALGDGVMMTCRLKADL